MRLAEDQALARMRSSDHGVLCTLHAERGADAVPVAFALDTDGLVGVPVDVIKPKASTRLQRERNLEADPRATILVEKWDADDWSQLWWVRASLRFRPQATADQQAVLGDLLEARYSQYKGQPFARVLVFEILGLTGWAAE